MNALHLNHYSLRLLAGHLLLTTPSLCAVLMMWIWNIDFLLLPPLLGIIGWGLVLPVTYTISRHSKERVAVDALANGLLMLCLCSLAVSITYGLKQFPKPPTTQKEQEAITKTIDLQDRELGKILEEES